MKDFKELKDEEVVEIIRKKDKELFIEIVLRYQKKLLRYATYLIQDQARAADIVQASLIKAYVNLNGFDVRLKFSSWIYRIVHNEAINIVNKRKKEKPLLENTNFASENGPEEVLTKKEAEIRVWECLNELPTSYAEPLSLHFLEEKSYEEISDILRLPVGTVGTRINRAKQMMKKICQK